MKFSTLTGLFLLLASSMVSAQQAKKFYLFPNAGVQVGWGNVTGSAYKLTNIERQSVSVDLGYYPFSKLGFFYQLGVSPSVISMSDMGTGMLRSENQVLLCNQLYASYTFASLGKAQKLRLYVNGGVAFNYCLSKSESHVDLSLPSGPVDDEVYGYSAVTTYLVAETGARFVFGNGNFLSLGLNYAHGLNSVFERQNTATLQYAGLRSGVAFRIFR